MTNTDIKGLVHSVIKKKERKEAGWNKRKGKTMTPDMHLNLVKSDKGSFYNQKEWLERYEYGKDIFCSDYDDDKNCMSSEDNDSNWEESPSEEDESLDSNTAELPTAYSCHNIFFLFFSPLSSGILLLFSGYEKRLLQSIYDTKK